LDGPVDLPTPTFRSVGRPPSADASVRDAAAADAAAIGAVQAQAWQASYDGVLPAETLAALEPRALAEVWREAIVRPPTRAHRVLVALAAGAVVGFVAIGPSEGAAPDVGEVLALVVAPAAQRAGHGSRLLNAAADRLRQAGFDQVVVWVLGEDDVRRAFMAGAGFAADGAYRTLAAEGADALREVRLLASLETPA
jgi:ribosomal protein S18 acetylase RimI-like enzyme